MPVRATRTFSIPPKRRFFPITIPLVVEHKPVSATSEAMDVERSETESARVRVRLYLSHSVISLCLHEPQNCLIVQRETAFSVCESRSCCGGIESLATDRPVAQCRCYRHQTKNITCQIEQSRAQTIRNDVGVWLRGTHGDATFLELVCVAPTPAALHPAYWRLWTKRKHSSHDRNTLAR